MDLETVGRRFHGNHVGECRVSRIVVAQILDHVRRFVTGVAARMVRIGVDVKTEIRQPVRIENQERIGVPVAGTPANLLERLDRGRATAFQRALPLREKERRHVRNLGG